MIAAVGRNGELGKNNALLWRLEGDLPFFKRVTMGCPVVMGRRTFESLPKALPGRKNVVLTRGGGEFPGAYAADGIPSALRLCAGADTMFVIGGAQIYRLFLPLADELYLTEAEAEAPDADAWFPAFPKAEWKRRVLDVCSDGIPYEHVLYTRI